MVGPGGEVRGWRRSFLRYPFHLLPNVEAEQDDGFGAVGVDREIVIRRDHGLISLEDDFAAPS